MVGKRRQQDSGYTPIWLTKPVQLLCESTVGCRHHMGRGPESWPEVAQEDGDMRSGGCDLAPKHCSASDSQNDRQTAAQRNV